MKLYFTKFELVPAYETEWDIGAHFKHADYTRRVECNKPA